MIHIHGHVNLYFKLFYFILLFIFIYCNKYVEMPLFSRVYYMLVNIVKCLKLSTYIYIFCVFAMLLMYNSMTDWIIFFLPFCSWGYYALYWKINSMTDWIIFFLILLQLGLLCLILEDWSLKIVIHIHGHVNLHFKIFYFYIAINMLRCLFFLLVLYVSNYS